MYTNDRIYTTERMTGGIKRFKMLYEGLKKEGYNVTLYCGETEDYLKEHNINGKSISRSTNKKFLFPSINIFINNAKKLKEIKKSNYDKVIVFDVPTAIGLCLKKIKKINLFLRQDLIEYRKVILQSKKKGRIFSFFYLKFMCFCEYICCKRAEKIIVQCNYDLTNLCMRHHNIKKKIMEKSYIQINNINVPWIIDSLSKNDKDIKVGDSFNISFIGDFSNARKGHGILLPTVSKIIEEGYNIEVYIIGDGKELEKYKSMYKKIKRIHFLGRLENPFEMVKKTNLVVVPSLADSCPNTVLESMYNNILVIGSNTGGIPEIIRNEEQLFDLDSEAIEKKIVKIISDNEYRKSLLYIQNIRAEELKFNWEEKIIDILNRR